LCSEAFCWNVQRPFDYAISGLLASLFFTQDHIDGLAYSSSATGMKGANLALKPSVADDYVIPKAFCSYRVATQNSPIDFVVECTGYAFGPDHEGRIDWGKLVDCPGHRISLELYERPDSTKFCGDSALSESAHTPHSPS
jgi:hypothetical protein